MFLVIIGVILLAFSIWGIIILSLYEDSRYYIWFRGAIPIIFLVVIAGFIYINAVELNDYLSKSNSSITKLFNSYETYERIGIFATLLGFYQVLLDRFNNYRADIENRNPDETSE